MPNLGLKAILGSQLLMGLWVFLNGFFVGEMHWSFSVILFLVSAALLIGGGASLARKPFGRVFSLTGAWALATISASVLGYGIHLLFQSDLKLGIQGLYPVGILVYSVCLAIYHHRSTRLRHYVTDVF